MEKIATVIAGFVVTALTLLILLFVSITIIGGFKLLEWLLSL